MSEKTLNQANITIDGKEYEWASLPESVRSELQMVIYIDNKLKESQQDIYAYQTAKNAYLASIKNNLQLGEKSEKSAFEEESENTDSIDFSAFNLS